MRKRMEEKARKEPTKAKRHEDMMTALVNLKDAVLLAQQAADGASAKVDALGGTLDAGFKRNSTGKIDY